VNHGLALVDGIELKGLSKSDSDAYTALPQLIQAAICERERGGGTR
jgi:hypothetical protein